MAFENLFIRTRKDIEGIQLDAVIRESHSNKVRTTDNPVELGADITDNAIIEPKLVSILAEVTDSPLGFQAGNEIVDSVTGLFGSSTSNNITRSEAAYNALLQLKEAREPIEIQTKLRLYTNMLIVDVSTSQDKDSSRSVLLNITAKEVFITDTEVVSLESSRLKSGPTRKQASSADKKGRQETKVPDNQTNRSTLKSLADWL